MKKLKTVFGTNSSVPVTMCQVCSSPKLTSIVSLGYMPTVSTAEKIGEAHGQPEYPTDLLYCENCDLIQIGIVIDPKVLFQPKYTYTSSTTRILRENFAELYREATELIDLKKKDLVVDIGSNDGNLLSNFKDNHRVLGVTPEQIGKMAIKKGIPTIIDYFRAGVVAQIKKKYGKAKIVTATNVFAHIEDVNQVVKNILNLMTPDGVFISESGYVITLLKETQYDNVYHEHLRYYSLHSIKYLLNMHGLEVFHAKRIPTHGGSIRVYASRKGQNKVLPSVKALLKEEEDSFSNKKLFAEFKKNVIASKLGLYDILSDIKKKNKRIYAISAPARATTLVHYVGLDENIIECVLEVQGSQKIGTYVPGTLIPIFEESKLMKDQPEYALLLSWHIAKHLMPKMKQSGFKGDFIVPLPKPMIVLNKDVKA